MGEGYKQYEPKVLKKIQQEELKVLKEFIRICDNTLHYILRPHRKCNYLQQQKYPNKQPHTLPIYHSVRKGTEENFF